MLSYNWTRHLKNTIFICPDGHEKCEINPKDINGLIYQMMKILTIINQTILSRKKNYFIY